VIVRVPRDLQGEHRRHQFVGLSFEGHAVRRSVLAGLCLPGASTVVPSTDKHQRDGTDGTRNNWRASYLDDFGGRIDAVGGGACP
jgi:hypothetical protein